jgi:hypothetical protein
MSRLSLRSTFPAGSHIAALIWVNPRATGCRISLGVELDAATFDKIPDFVATSYCGSCAATIRGRKTDAWIEAAEFEQAR